MIAHIIYASLLVIMFIVSAYYRAESSRLYRENKQACLNETLARNQSDYLRRELDSAKYRQNSRTDHRVMVLEDENASLKAQLKEIEEKHVQELSALHSEIRTKEMLITTFKQQIDRLSGWEEIHKTTKK